MLISGLGRGSRFRALATGVAVVAMLIVLCGRCTTAFGATTISVSSRAVVLRAELGGADQLAVAGRCSDITSPLWLKRGHAGVPCAAGFPSAAKPLIFAGT